MLASLPRVGLAVVALAVVAGGAGAQPAAPTIIYLDFADGSEVVTFGPVDDATRNQSSIGAANPYPAFVWPTVSTGAESRAAVVSRIARRVHEVFLPYNVLITLVRPASGPYTTVMIGGHPLDLGLTENYGGVAFMDCGNREDVNLVFVFPAKLRGNEQGLVATIAQETAHALGLEHTVNVRDLMHPVLAPNQVSFVDEESAVSSDGICGNPIQNSHRKLIDTVGAWRGDDKPFDDGSRADRQPPRLVLLEPAAGATVGQPFALLLAAEDESGIDHVVLTAEPGRQLAVLRHPPFGVSLGGFPAGPLAVSLTAYDRSGNTSTRAFTFTVTPDAPLPGGCAVAAAPALTPVVTLPAALLVFCLLARLARRAQVLYKPAFRKRPGHTRFRAMPKKGLHPLYKAAVISCACGNKVDTYSTRGSFMVDICSQCHPFYTGKQKFVDTAGRIEKFNKKYQTAPAAGGKKPAPPAGA